jgi:hypothetical protein
VTGNGIEDRGVPGGTLTVKLSFWPVTRVTVTTHGSAEALGSHASIAPAARTLAETTPSKSFRLLNTVA